MKKNLLIFLLVMGGSISNLKAMLRQKEEYTVILSLEDLGRQFRTKISQTTTVHDLKMKSENLLKRFPKNYPNLSPESQRIIYLGEELKDSKNLIKEIKRIGKERVSGPGEPILKLEIIEERKAPPSTFSAPPSGAPRPPFPPYITQRRVAFTALTLAALTAAVAGIMKIRSYKRRKGELIRKYQLGNLTPLQNKTWLATVLASYHMPYPYLHRLVRTNPGTLIDFVGSDPRALAELYYGHEPTQVELNRFLVRFFESKL